MPFTPSRLSALLLVVGLGTVELGLLDPQMGFSSRAALAQGAMSLSIRRGQGGVEVVIQEAGPQPVLKQRLNGRIWQGSLQTQRTPGVLNGRQQISDPVAGLQRVSISGSGSAYLLEVVPMQGQTLQEPVVSADGRNLILRFPGLTAGPSLQTGRIDLNTPGRVPQSRYAPPLRPRAVAPPLGDMAVGTMVLQNRSYVNVSGPPVTLTLNDAPAKDALMALARLGGYGFVYVPEPRQTNKSNKNGSDPSTDLSQAQLVPKVSAFFQDESYPRALNSLLVSSGMEARLQGNTLFAGKSLAKVVLGSQVSKVVRLNQVQSDSAAEYLSTLGAEFCNTVLPGQYKSAIEQETAFGSGLDSEDGDGESNSTYTSDISPGETEIQCYGKEDSSGPLYGMSGTHDQRLNTITLVGESRLVEVAEKYLKTLDLRKRQVAVKVQILNIDLRNDVDIDSSFSASIGNTFLVSENGKAFMNFGDYRPGNSAGTGALGNGTNYATPGAYTAGFPMQAAQDVVDASVQSQEVFKPPYVPKLETVTTTDPDTGRVTVSQIPVLIDGSPVYVQSQDPSADPTLVPRYDSQGRPIYVPSSDPAASPSLIPRYDKNGQPIYVAGQNPNEFSYPKNSFYSYIEAQIVSSNAKTLASPTLLVQEGSGAKVVTGTSVIVDAKETVANNITTISTERETAGLALTVDVERIDDNGFITLSVDPTVSVPRPSGASVGNVDLFNIDKRSLNSGQIRLRDRQTLVLTGVIQDSDRAVVTKWPVLGDLPFIGQLFRGSSSQRDKQELVILVTPYIVDDRSGGNYGYGYRPVTRESRQLLGTN